jgi:hypothetical protein
MLLHNVFLHIPIRPKDKTDAELLARAKKEALSQAVDHYFSQIITLRDGTLMDFYALVWMPEAAQIIFREWKECVEISWLKCGF